MESYEQIEMHYFKNAIVVVIPATHIEQLILSHPFSHFRVFIVILCAVAMRSRKFCVNAQRTPRKVHVAWLAQNS